VLFLLAPRRLGNLIDYLFCTPARICPQAGQLDPIRSTCATKTLFFNVEVNFRRGAVLGYLLTIQFHL
jgi:hypothetical protein